MGIVKRQGFKFALVNYLGTAIGFLSILFIYDLDRGSYGFTQFILSFIVLLAPFSNVGLTSLIVKYYPYFQKENKGNAFFTSVLLLLGVFFVLFFIIWILFIDDFVHFLQSKGFSHLDLILDHKYGIALLILFYTLTIACVQQARNYLRIVVPEIVLNLGLKLALPVIVLLSYLGYINFSEIVWLLVLFHALTFVILFGYLLSLRSFTTSIVSPWAIDKTQRKDIFYYALYSVLAVIGSGLAFRVDSVMVTSFLGEFMNGNYMILYMLSNIIAIPTKSVNGIVSPIISDDWEKGNLDHINEMYKKSALYLTIGGVLFLIIIWNLLPVFDEFSKSGSPVYTEYALVFLVLGLARLVDMVTGVNHVIISYSPSYRMNLYFLLFLAILNVSLNYIFIQQYGLIGAAVSTFISLLIYNIIKGLFLFLKYRLNPFGLNIVPLLLISAVIFILFQFLDFGAINRFVALVLIPLAVGVVYLGSIVLLRIAPDLNASLDSTLTVLRHKEYTLKEKFEAITMGRDKDENTE